MGVEGCGFNFQVGQTRHSVANNLPLLQHLGADQALSRRPDTLYMIWHQYNEDLILMAFT